LTGINAVPKICSQFTATLLTITADEMGFEPRLSKSRYLAGLQCSRRLWLAWHDPEPRPEPEPGSVLAVGTEIGVAARQLAPGGILVDEGPDQHDQAVERTRALVARPDVLAIFEAAFTFDRTRIRTDILERLPTGGWRLAEVKSSSRVKPEHLQDLAIQAYVVSGCGITLEEIQLVHVDTGYVRGSGEIDWQRYFEREVVTQEVRDLLPAVPEHVAEMHAILALQAPPTVRPSGQCFSPFGCEFWDRCTIDKPPDWIFYLPRLRRSRFAELDARGVESMRDIPADFPLTQLQRRTVEVVTSGREFVSEGLGKALEPLIPPAIYLDFETFSPAIPVYPGTRPYQRIPFQWSIHHDDGHGNVTHYEFLADGGRDPRREFAETLLEALGRLPGPVIVYSGFEASVLRELAGLILDLSDQLLAVLDRLFDLLPIIRTNVSHPEFLGSYSIKAVAPALVPDLTYDNLDIVADGGEAATVFYRVATDCSLTDDDRTRYRHALLAYCARDTLALLSVHQGIYDRVMTADLQEPQKSNRELCPDENP
jgi:predicted RecB family nuclease